MATPEHATELDCIAAALDAVAAGRGRTVVIEGPAGIGSTRLIADARAPAKLRGCGRMWMVGDELGSAMRWAVVRQLVERSSARHGGETRQKPLAGSTGAAPATLSRALDEARAGDAAPATLSCALDEARAGDAAPATLSCAPHEARAGDAAPARTLHSLWCIATDLASYRRVLITVDDAPWPGAPSLRLLAHVAPRAGDLPIALIIATRPPAGRSGPLAELVGPRHGDGRCPQPLSSEAIGEPATRHEVAPAPAVLEALRAASGGNAPLAGALIARVVVHVLTRSGGSAKLRFGHPVVREAALAELGPGERAALHAAAPTASHGAGAPSDRVAAHLAAAPAATSPEAAALLRLAAADLLIDGDATTAASHLRRALEDTPGDDAIRADGPAVAIDELRSARVLCAPALDGRAAIGDRPRRLMFAGADTLVASERRIAELASRGRSNRDIAGDLVVTPKTVENHLGRVYMKLNIKGRGELSTALAA